MKLDGRQYVLSGPDGRFRSSLALPSSCVVQPASTGRGVDRAVVAGCEREGAAAPAATVEIGAAKCRDQS